jgi:type II secretion system protein I
MAGFTLMEVAVALLILSTVLASSLQLVNQYADERERMRDRFLANQVAWNNLMEQYRSVQKWPSGSGSAERSTKGVELQGDRDWRWELKVEEAMGQNLYRYEIEVRGEGAQRPRAVMAAFFIDT